MVTVDEEGNCLDGTSAEDAAKRIDEVGRGRGRLQLQRRAGDCAFGDRTHAQGDEAAAGRDAECRDAEVDRRTQFVSDFAGVYGELREEICKGRRAFCGWMLRHDSAVHAGDARRTASAGSAGDGCGNCRVGRRRSGEGEQRRAPAAEGSFQGGGDDCRRTVSARWWRSFRPRASIARRKLEGAGDLHRLGVDAINVPDSPRASARMSAQSLCVQIQQRVGIETVLHYTCRDRNLLSIQSDLLGAASIGVKNILCLTGDPPKMGSYPNATAVFDVDAIGLVKIVRDLNHGLDIGGNSIGASAAFTLSVAANPGVADIDNEVAPVRGQGGGRRRVRHYAAGLRPAPAG